VAYINQRKGGEKGGGNSTDDDVEEFDNYDDIR